MDSILARGKIRALTDYSSTSYFIYKGVPMGYEYDLLHRLADDLKVTLKIKLTANIEEASELKDYLDGPVIMEVEKIRVDIKKNAEVYNLLEEYKFKFEPKEIENRWVIYKKPRDIIDMVT